jgi:hypothetical protein
MLARIATLVLAAATLAVAGCGPQCNSSSVCAVVGSGSDIQVCDGSDYRSCNDGNRGEQVPCVHRPEIALCTTTGWTFVPAN